MPTSPYVPPTRYPAFPSSAISDAVERAIRVWISERGLERVGDLSDLARVREDMRRDAYEHRGILPLYTLAYPFAFRRALYARAYDILTRRGTLGALDILTENIEASYAIEWTLSPAGRRISAAVDVYPFAASVPDAAQRRYLLAAYRWLMGTQAAVSAVRIIERDEFPVRLGIADVAYDFAEV